jgi:hypothetical protein
MRGHFVLCETESTQGGINGVFAHAALAGSIGREADGETAEKLEPKPASPAQLLYAKKIAQGKGVVIPDEAKANSAAMAVWIDSNQGKQRRKSSRKIAFKPAGGFNFTSIDVADEEVSETQG